MSKQNDNILPLMFTYYIQNQIKMEHKCNKCFFFCEYVFHIDFVENWQLDARQNRRKTVVMYLTRAYGSISIVLEHCGMTG